MTAQASRPSTGIPINRSRRRRLRLAAALRRCSRRASSCSSERGDASRVSHLGRIVHTRIRTVTGTARHVHRFSGVRPGRVLAPAHPNHTRRNSVSRVRRPLEPSSGGVSLVHVGVVRRGLAAEPARQRQSRGAQCSRSRVDAFVQMPLSRHSAPCVPESQRIGERRELGNLRPAADQPRKALIERLNGLATDLASGFGPHGRKLRADDFLLQRRRRPCRRHTADDRSLSRRVQVPKPVLHELLRRVWNHPPSVSVVQAGVCQTV